MACYHFNQTLEESNRPPPGSAAVGRCGCAARITADLAEALRSRLDHMGS